MNLFEKPLHSKMIYRGRIINVRDDEVELQNGKHSFREVCEHPGGVAILALDPENCVTLVRQYRYPFESAIWEIPAGKFNPGERDHKLCGLRELREETGIVPEEFLYLGSIYPSPGFLNEQIHLYLARGLTVTQQELDEDEFMDVRKFPFDMVREMILCDEIKDAKTIAAVMKVSNLLGI